MQTDSDPTAAVLRLRLPDLVRVMTRDGARRLILRGDLGPYLRCGRRIIRRRESVLAALAARETPPPPAPGRPTPPAPRPEYVDLLRRPRRGGRP